jgi:hypothetical protein
MGHGITKSGNLLQAKGQDESHRNAKTAIIDYFVTEALIRTNGNRSKDKF